MDAELQTMLLKKAGSLLARRAHSRGELRIKLAKMADEVQVEIALDRLEQLNLLNDADYAYNFALCRIKQEGWGDAKVHASLLRRHVAQATIESAIERIRKETSEDSALTEYLRRYCSRTGVPTDPGSIRRLVLHLRRRGYDDDNILSVLRRTVPATIMRHFETGE